ncbi:MAG TPA: alpha/beta hydrolase domain-containing protein [Acidimicrobiales bacterium]|nr:alpha/beta hydrolase domain-containing protein [Acidimicrobiales bacterium]
MGEPTAGGARIEGPVAGGDHGWAFGAPLFDLADHGYRLDEWFLEGDATTYRQVPGGAWGHDGRWEAEPSGSLPFRTRLVVYRPADPARANGTVLVCWNNVTAGYELFGGESPETLDGYVFVGATVQRVGVHGFAEAPQGLAAWDPTRYGSLSIPHDDASYDIFRQVGAAVGRDRPGRGGAGDPLSGIDVSHVAAVGASQSAGRLATYVNALHPLVGGFDAYMLQIYFGSGTPLEAGDLEVNLNRPAAQPAALRLRGSHLLRDDLDVPVMVVNSELEAVACAGVRQPDTDRFRWWETAGTCHVSLQSMRVRAPKYEREFGVAQPVDEGMNRVSIQPVYDAATAALRRWLDDGTPPPVQPKVEMAEAATADRPARPARDAFGLAVGGIRLPQVDEPLMRHGTEPRGSDARAFLNGSSTPLGRDEVIARYGDEATYLDRFRAAAERTVAAGALLARDVEPLVEEARSDWAEVVGEPGP